jgi:hypothetical protein
LDKATSKVEQLNDRKMQLEESRIKMENELGWFVARQKADADRQLIDVKNKLIDAEVA